MNKINNTESFCHESISMRIDKALCIGLPRYSRNILSQLIEKGVVTVNDKQVIKNSFIVGQGDKVVINLSALNAEISFQGLQPEIPIISEKKDFLVINKPAGLLSHPAATAKTIPSVVSILSEKIKFEGNFPDLARPGIVHRLDRDTSGILIVAKKAEAYHRFAEIFQQRKIKKTYLALVVGVPAWDKLSISKPIGRDPRNPTKMKVFGIAAKEAKTFIKVLKKGFGATLLEVEIITGRTHQIRVHLASVGFPVFGDFVYGRASDLFAYQALHAHTAEFSYLRTKHSFRAKLPDNLIELFFKFGICYENK